MFANEDLFLLGPDETEEVACGPLGLGERQGVGRAQTTLPAPSQCPSSAGPAPSAPSRRPLLKQCWRAMLYPYMATRGRPTPPATMRPASQRTPSGRRSLSCRNSIDPPHGWRIVPSGGALNSAPHKEPLGHRGRDGSERGWLVPGHTASPWQSREVPSQVLSSWV